MSDKAKGAAAKPVEVREMLRTVLSRNAVTMQVVQKGGLKDGEVLESAAFPLAEVPDVLKARGKEVAIKAYALGVLLHDRTSQVKEQGAKAALAAMRAYFEVFKKGMWREYAEARTPYNPLLPDAIIIAYGYPAAARSKVVERLKTKTADEIGKLEKEHADVIARLERERGEAEADISF